MKTITVLAIAFIKYVMSNVLSNLQGNAHL